MEGAPLSFEKGQERKEEAFKAVVDLFYEKLEEVSGDSFESKGRTYSLESIADCIVANAQLSAKAAESVLEAVRGKDYFKEKAANKILEMMRAKETYEKRVAEIEFSSPEIADRLRERFPEVGEIKDKGKERLAEVNEAA